MVDGGGLAPATAGEVVDALVLLVLRCFLFAGLEEFAFDFGGHAVEGCFGGQVVNVDVVHFALGDVAARCGLFGYVKLRRARWVFAGHFGDFGAEGAEEGV